MRGKEKKNISEIKCGVVLKTGSCLVVVCRRGREKMEQHELTYTLGR